jgi:hypothetical protein
MKNISNTILAVFLLILVSCSQNQISNTAEFSIKVEDAEFDFGKIAYDSPAIHEFQFINNGKEPLIITNVKSSCGCTVPTFPKDPIEVGLSGNISVKYDTKKVGHFNKSITVYSNSKDSPTTLHIKGEVEAPKEN